MVAAWEVAGHPLSLCWLPASLLCCLQCSQLTFILSPGSLHTWVLARERFLAAASEQCWSGSGGGGGMLDPDPKECTARFLRQSPNSWKLNRV